MSDPKHIALVLASFRAGGAEKAMIQLANGFNSGQNTTDLVVVENTGEFVSLVQEGIKIVDLKKKRARNAILAFSKYLELNSPEVIIAAQTHIHLMVLLALKISRWNGILILNEHSTFSMNNKSFFYKILVKNLFNNADAITVISVGAAEDFANKFPFIRNKITVIPNAVYSDDILQKKEINISHPFLNNKKFPVILSAGRLTKSKNHKLLLESFSLILKQKEARLIIIGEGEERVNLENYVSRLGISSVVSFTGHVSNPYAYMRLADVFVLSSDYEGLPTVLIEALACGCNIVSTNCPNGPAEILENGKYGTLVPVDNSRKLADAILGNLSEHINISDKLLKAKEYSIDAIADNYIRLINRLQLEK